MTTPSAAAFAAAALAAGLLHLAGCGGGSGSNTGGDTNASGAGGSNAVAAVNLPSVSVSSKSASQIVLQWQAPAAAVAKYRIMRGDRPTALAEVTGTSYTDTDVQANASYVYVIHALNAAGDDAAVSSPLAVNTLSDQDTTPPSIPASVQASAINATRIRIDWSASADPSSPDSVLVSGVAGYQITRRTGSASATQSFSSSATSLTDSSVAPLTTYHYQVKAIDHAGNVSGLSSDVAVTTPALPDTSPPTVPANLTGRATSTTSVDLAWTASSDDVGVARYQIFRNASASVLAETTAVAYVDTTAAPGTAYTYQVRALDAAGNASALSTVASVTTAAVPDITAPSAPANLSATATSATSVSLSWDASTDNRAVAGYRIYRNGGSTALAQIAATSFTDTTTKPITSYSYQVRAVDASGNVSPLSTVASATTPFVHPGIFVGNDQLAIVKAQIAAGAQPMKLAFDKVKASSVGSLSYMPHAVAWVECTGVVGDNCYLQMLDAQAAYTDALLYRLTGNKAYGDKAVAIMDAWSSTMQGFNFTGGTSGAYKDTALWAAWIAEVFPRAAELMRYSDYGWPQANAKKFGDMMQYHLSFVNYEGSSMGSFDWAGNWALSFGDAMIAIAVYNDDAALFARGVGKWRASMTSAVYLAGDPGGHPVSPASYYHGVPLTNLTALNTDWHSPTAYVEGMEQETCRDLGHVAMALGAAVNSAETGYIQGLDLYGEQLDRLVKGIEYNNRFFNNSQFVDAATAATRTNPNPVATAGVWVSGADVSGWNCPYQGPVRIGYLEMAVEPAYNHVVGRLGLSMPETKKLLGSTYTLYHLVNGQYQSYNQPARPTGNGNHLNWGTLTHGIPLQ